MKAVFSGSLTHSDSKRHIMHGFEVPENAGCLRASLEHRPRRAAGADYNNQVSLSLFDPEGARGARHNNADQTIYLSAARAAPGYLPGPILPGNWMVVLDVHRILPPDTLEYRITVDVDADTRTPDESPSTCTPGTTAPRGPGWYRGDLHCHSLHSDGAWDVPDLVQFARERALDFIALTDHNTVSGLAQLDSLADDNLLTIGGMELTTYHGHALMLGTRQWHEWRQINGRTITDNAREILNEGIFFIIAHPLTPGDPVCTGCRWQYQEMMPGIAPAVEIWNREWAPYNEDGLNLYYSWLNRGCRLVATAGSDMHRRPDSDAQSGAVNVVYAEELSESAVLNAVRRGRLYLSSGPVLHLTVPGDPEVMTGGSVPRAKGIHARVCWSGARPGDSLRLIVNGRPNQQISAAASGETQWNLPDSETRWFLAELRDSRGNMCAVTNPIFAEQPQ